MRKKLEQFLKKSSAEFHDFRLDNHYKQELKNLEKNTKAPIRMLDLQEKQEIEEYYRALGFSNIDTRWHRYIYSTTGKMDKRHIPENFYHMTIEPMFTRGDPSWEDKAYMQFFLPDIQFPVTLARRVNGYFLDDRHDIISKEEAISKVRTSDSAIIKPSLGTGGGRGVALISGRNFGQELIDAYGLNFIVQQRLEQHPCLASFNQSSVNTEKIISFMYRGQVHILTSILRVGATGAITDTASGGNGFTVGIQEDGRLNETGYSILGTRFTENAEGRKFSDIVLPAHAEICDTIRFAHKKLPPYFGLVSWDFATDEAGRPVLIEYNLNYPDVLIYQMNNGPLFGENTDEWLKEISKMKR